MSDRPVKFTRAMYLLEQRGYTDVCDYVEQLEDEYGEELRAEEETESDDEDDESDPEAEEDVDPEPPEDATEESEDETTEESDEDDNGDESGVSAAELTDKTVSEVEDVIGDVDDPDVLEAAYEEDDRTTARDVYADRYEELTGDTLGGDDG